MLHMSVSIYHKKETLCRGVTIVKTDECWFIKSMNKVGRNSIKVVSWGNVLSTLSFPRGTIYRCYDNKQPH